MTQKIKKQFGIWKDTHHATIVGRANANTEDFSVPGNAANAGGEYNTSEKNEHQDKKHCNTNFLKKYYPLCKMQKRCI